MEQEDDCTMPELPPPELSTAPTTVEDIKAGESSLIWQKVLFLAVIVGCIGIYLRISKVKQEDSQGYEKNLA